MKSYGRFLTKQTVDVDEIAVTTSNDVYTDEVLRSKNYYPIVETGDQHPEAMSRLFKYTLVHDDEGGHIEQRVVVIPVVKTYSKLKIIMGSQLHGFFDQFIQLMDSDPQLKIIWDASNVIEDNSLLRQYLPEIAFKLNKSQEELQNFLDTECIAD